MHIHEERNELRWTNDCCCSFVVSARLVCGWMRLRKRYTESIKSSCVACRDVICNLLLIYAHLDLCADVYVMKHSPTKSGSLAAGRLICLNVSCIRHTQYAMLGILRNSRYLEFFAIKNNSNILIIFRKSNR